MRGRPRSGYIPRIKFWLVVECTNETIGPAYTQAVSMLSHVNQCPLAGPLGESIADTNQAQLKKIRMNGNNLRLRMEQTPAAILMLAERKQVTLQRSDFYVEMRKYGTISIEGTSDKVQQTIRNS